MKKLITFICIIIFCTLSISAQEKKGSRGKIKALKISYITEQLSLTSEEAQKFWPIYNNHENNTNKYIREKIGEIKKEISKAESIDALNEDRAKVLYNMIRSLEKKKYEDSKIYISKLEKIISFKKILKLHIAEREFGRKLMRKYKHKRGN
ncbi:hypothetical protein [Polaribacter sp. SA4-12]|uniref:hypothetical protein n=1 Tax=Polaribacter sp. SA4-12 TaxID=1312072 RepID=UPI000B3D1E6F|nr:hypothetical protein [Polaribacter sp. SA4-12]